MNSLGFPDYAIVGPGATIPFNLGSPDDAGSYWYMEGELNGWDSPDGRVTMLPKIGVGPVADGEFPADQHYRGRTLTFKINASCPTEAAREASRYLIAEALDLTDTTGFFYANEPTPKQLVISRTGNNNQGKLTVTDLGTSAPAPITQGMTVAQPGGSDGLIYPLSAEVEIYATDPRKYVQTVSRYTFTSLAATIDNNGNTDTANFLMHLTGLGGFRGTLDIVIAGVGTFVLTIPTLPAGAPTPASFPDPLVVDFYNKTIEDNLGNSYYYLRDLRYPWLAVPPGTGRSVTLSEAGAGGFVDISSAWI